MRTGLIAILLVVAGLFATPALAIDVDKLPKPAGYVSDLANVVDANSKVDLEAFCARVESQLGVQFALVTIDTLDDRPIRDIGLDIFRKWGVGAKGTNQGVLLLLSIKDRRSDIETGRGIEPYITDGFSGSTLRAMRTDLRAGDYGSALKSAASSMAAQIAQGKGVAFSGGFETTPQPSRSSPQRSRGRGVPLPLIVFGIFVLLWLFTRNGRRGGGMRGGGGNFGGGFVTGMLLNSLLDGGRGRGGSDWGGGGFGGDSGGGGGFGGFGGGDAGGGGASSDW